MQDILYIVYTSKTAYELQAEINKFYVYHK